MNKITRPISIIVIVFLGLVYPVLLAIHRCHHVAEYMACLEQDALYPPLTTDADRIIPCHKHEHNGGCAVCLFNHYRHLIPEPGVGKSPDDYADCLISVCGNRVLHYGIIHFLSPPLRAPPLTA